MGKMELKEAPSMCRILVPLRSNRAQRIQLSSIALYVNDKISSSDISLEEYVTTDCILQNKRGREIATNLPPQPCSLIHYKPGDILIANIRPYLKKIWYADMEGGASSDVLVFRSKEGHSPEYLYAALLQDAFFDYVMQGTKGSKMPRGDKEQIMRYEMPTLSTSEESIGKFILDINQKIALNKSINDNLEALAKQLYDYWFVQFDFPNEEGKPYKSSGGKMVWNEELKREIPDGWKTKKMQDISLIRRGASPRPIDEFMDDTHKGMPWLKISDATINDSPFVVSIKEHSISRGVSKSVVIEEGTLVVTNSATPGLPKFIQERCCVHDGWLVLTEYKDEMKFYLYYVLDNMRKALERMASGSIFKNLRTDYLQNYFVLVPPKELLQRYSEIVGPIMQEALRISLENESLIKQRDELLPLLMNGQVSLLNCD